jgi:hypothetical protein
MVNRHAIPGVGVSVFSFFPFSFSFPKRLYLGKEKKRIKGAHMKRPKDHGVELQSPRLGAHRCKGSLEFILSDGHALLNEGSLTGIPLF